MIAKERFYELRNHQGLINTEELDEVFNALEPVSCESILGKWKGGDFNTGHKGIRPGQGDKMVWKNLQFSQGCQTINLLQRKRRNYSIRNGVGRPACG